jgi:hypothetical protein
MPQHQVDSGGGSFPVVTASRPFYKRNGRFITAFTSADYFSILAPGITPVQDRPLGYFIHISMTSLIVSALKNYYI